VYSNTLSNIDFTDHHAPPGGQAILLHIRRQAGCMAKTEKRKTSAQLPADVSHAVTAAFEKQARDLIVLDLRATGGFTDYFLICSGGNSRQNRAIADGITEVLAAEKGIKPAHIEGYDRADWLLLDYFDFIVHIFSPEPRAFYDLERLWGNAERIEIDDPSAKPAP
jgi:ribosome-associated protein